MIKGRTILVFLAAMLALPLLAQTSTTSPVSLAPPVEPQSQSTTGASTPPASPAKQAQGRPLTADDVNAWLDGFFPYAIGKANIPGAVVVVVKDGAVLTQRGFGLADVARRRPVDPRRTLFRPGSISKLFTWTAVMQQVEQGRLNLDEDVNRYLDFRIPAYQGKPVTLRNIMTHTAGFEEQAKGIITTKREDYKGFESLLKQWVPERVYPAGSTPAYSNYATSLAGYIVQRVSGQPFDDYLDRNIFGPLGMSSSTFRQPLPANLRPLMSEGYRHGKKEPYGFEFVGASPAGSLSATGEDMSRFMIAHLQGGAFGTNRILRPETARIMHRSISKPLPPLNGMALGFYEANINGRSVIAHGGDTVAFHSNLHLFLDDGVGLFVSMNSGGREGASGNLRTALFEGFADRYFPAPDKSRPIDEQTARRNAEKLAGFWEPSRRSHSSFVAAAGLLGQTEVSVGPKGELSVPGADGLNGQPRTWIAIGPMLWKDRDGHELLAAKLDGDRAVRYSFARAAPIMVWDRVPWHRSSAWLLPLLYLALAVLVITAFLWPMRAIVRRSFDATLSLDKRGLQAYRASRIAAVAILATLIGWLVTVQTMFADLSNLSASMDPTLVMLQILSIITFIGGFAVMLWYCWTAWRGKWDWPAKLWSILLVISAFAVLWVGFAFNLVGMTTNY